MITNREDDLKEFVYEFVYEACTYSTTKLIQNLVIILILDLSDHSRSHHNLPKWQPPAQCNITKDDTSQRLI